MIKQLTIALVMSLLSISPHLAPLAPPSPAAQETDDTEQSEEGAEPLAGAPTIAGTAQDDVLDFEGFIRDASRAARTVGAAGPRPPQLMDFMRAGTCAVSDGLRRTPDEGLCADTDPPPECEEPATPLAPLWRRDRTTESAPWGPWELVSDWTCSTPDTPTELTATDFQRLPLAAPGIRVQPETPEVLVNIPTITMADAPDQTLTTTLLGTQVEVRAEATSYTWNYGDGTDPVTTTSPGHPYPDEDVHHTYLEPGTYTITLTATWTGQWRLTGTEQWLPVQGTATTTATHTPITAVEARARLVQDNCHENPDGPGC